MNDQIITAEWRRFAAQFDLPPNVELRVWLGENGHRIARMVARTLSKEVVEERQVEAVPSDWWQHFKLRWFPQYLRRRFPIHYRQILIVSVFNNCPHITVPGISRHVSFLDSGIKIEAVQGMMGLTNARKCDTL